MSKSTTEEAPAYKIGDVVMFMDYTSPNKKAKQKWLRGKIAAQHKLGVFLISRENGTGYAVLPQQIHSKTADQTFALMPRAKKHWAKYFNDDITSDIEKLGLTKADIDKATADLSNKKVLAVNP